jgi:outer membrane autotransporter protein
VQSGIDLYRNTSPGGYESRAGFFGGYARSQGDVSGFVLGQQNNFAGTAQVEAFSVGGYWTQMGIPGWYVDTIVLGSRFDGNGKSTNQVGIRTDGFGVAASIEAGYPIPLGGGIRIEPQAQFVYQYLDFEDTGDVFSSIAHDTSHGIAGRLGLRLAADTIFMGTRVSPYLKASVWQDWTGTDRVVFANTHVVDARQRGTSVEVGGGIVAQLANNVGLWASADYITDVAGEGEREIVRGNVGIRWLW